MLLRLPPRCAALPSTSARRMGVRRRLSVQMPRNPCGIRQRSFWSDMSAVYVGIFHVLQGLVAVGNKVLMVALQIIASNGLGARDAVEVLQQEFCHGNALGENA